MRYSRNPVSYLLLIALPGVPDGVGGVEHLALPPLEVGRRSGDGGGRGLRLHRQRRRPCITLRDEGKPENEKGQSVSNFCLCLLFC